jgi:hypothetical protein
MIRRVCEQVVVVCAWVLVACESGPDLPSGLASGDDSEKPAGCLDLDRDGYGTGCSLGPDCDDRDPIRTLECGVERLGPCTSGTTKACYALSYLDEHTVSCESGTRTCVNGAWAKCDMNKKYTRRLTSSMKFRQSAMNAPVQCNACDPGCYMTLSVPDATDLTATNSSDVVYDSAEGGVAVVPSTTSGTGGDLPDGDGDGVPDMHDQYPADSNCDGYTNTGPSCGLAETSGGFFRQLPYLDPSVTDTLEITTQVRTADIYFLMDTTGSMQGEIDNLKSALNAGNYITDPTLCPSLTPAERNGVIGAIRCAIPDASFGVGYFDDFPASPTGNGGPGYDESTSACYHASTNTHHDIPFHNLQSMTTNASAVQSAVNRLVARCGNDIPESHLAGLYSVATGAGIPDTRSTSSRPMPLPPCTNIPVIDTDDAVTEQVPGTVESMNFSSYPSPWPSATSGQGDTQASAVDLGTITGWKVQQGTTNTGSIRNDYSGASYGCNSSTARDAVYKFRIATAGTYIFTTQGATWNTTLILRSSTFAALTGEPSCNDNANSSVNWSTIVRTMAPGDYYIIVDGATSSARGNFSLAIGPASGESMASATELGDLTTRTVRVAGSTLSMSDDFHPASGESCSHPIGAADAVFKFTVTQTTSISAWLDASTTSFSPVMYLRNASNGQVGCRFGKSTTSYSGWNWGNLSPGTYYLVVDGNNSSDRGTFALHIGPIGTDGPVGEKASNAYNLGDVTNQTKMVALDSRIYTSDFSGCILDLKCDVAEVSPDVYVRFQVSQTGNYAFSMLSGATGANFSIIAADESLVECVNSAAASRELVRHLTAGTYYLVADWSDAVTPLGGPMLFGIGPAVAEDQQTAYDLGDLSNRFVSVCDSTGDRSIVTRVDDVQGTSCWGFREGNFNSVVPEAVYKFTLNQPSNFFMTSDPNASWIEDPLNLYGLMVEIRDSNFQPIHCKDDFANGPVSMYIQLPAGTYYVVAQYDGDSHSPMNRGSFRLNMGADWSPGSTAPKYLVPRQSSCPAGTVGYPCFRDGSVPIVILMTDAVMHDALPQVFGGTRYEKVASPSFPDVIRAMQEQGTRFIGVNSGPRRSQSCAPGCLATQIQNVCKNRPRCTGTTERQCTRSTTCNEGSCWTTDSCADACVSGSVVNQYSCRNEEVCTSYGANVCTDSNTTADWALRQIGEATGSVDDTGEPYIYPINSDGSGMSTSIVDAVNRLANYTRMDITMEVLDNPSTSSMDERRFVQSITAVPSAATNTRCQRTHATWFENCLPGTMAEFAVELRNDFIPPVGGPFVYNFEVRTVGDGIYTLSTTPVKVLIPTGADVKIYPNDGKVWRNYEAVCPNTKMADWADLSWVTGSMPADTAIRFDIQTAENEADLATAPITSVAAPPAVAPVDVGAMLDAARMPNANNWLRVTAVLQASPDRLRVPVLKSFELMYRCVDRD